VPGNPQLPDIGGGILRATAVFTDSAGAVVNRYSYDPYGNVTSTSGAAANPWRFGGAYGAYTDAATGLVKIGQRYYDPALGRWTQRDLISGCASKPQGTNRYGYANGNPISNVDPSGLLSVDLCITVLSLVGSAVIGTLACGPICFGTLAITTPIRGAICGIFCNVGVGIAAFTAAAYACVAVLGRGN